MNRAKSRNYLDLIAEGGQKGIHMFHFAKKEFGFPSKPKKFGKWIFDIQPLQMAKISHGLPWWIFEG